jgi:hypothetical protein
MYKTQFKKILIVFMLFIAFFVSHSALAAMIGSDLKKTINTQTGAVNDTGIFTGDSLATIIASVIETFLSLLGIIFVILMLYGGFTWMTAQGDESKIEKAKNTIQTAIIGLIIVVSAYSITFTVFKSLN